jgi:hypothetical protein
LAADSAGAISGTAAGVCAASEIHDGPHKLALDMQKEALEWSDRWLNSESRRTTMSSISECPELLEQGFPSSFNLAVHVCAAGDTGGKPSFTTDGAVH